MRTLISLMLVVLIAGCDALSSQPQSATGVTKATTKVQTQSNGLTTEQNNIVERLKRDNASGSIKHLYILSAYSGQVLIYSTVKGKITSSGKRLTPNSVLADRQTPKYGFDVTIGGEVQLTSEVLQDDGTYGSSAEYIYWFSVDNTYHQHYISGGQIVHISDQPIAVKSVVLNMETSEQKD